MPNFTGNRLYIAGEPAAVDAFIERAHSARAGEEEMSLGFWEHVPEPSRGELAAQAIDWSKWRQLNWGTRAIYEPRLERASPETAFYTFATAWSPPRPWVARVAELHPALRFLLSFSSEGDFDSYWRTFVPDVSAREGQLPFREGFALFVAEGDSPEWAAAIQEALETPPTKFVADWDPMEIEQAFPVDYIEWDELDEEGVEEAEEILATLPAEAAVLEQALRESAPLVRLDHPEAGSRQVYLIGMRAEDEVASELERRRQLGSTGADEVSPPLAALLEGLRLTDDRVGQAVARLAATNVLERLGLVSEQA